MFCPFCGSQLTEDALFCTNCGNKLPSAEPAAPAVQSAGGFTAPDATANAGQAPASQSAQVWNDPYQAAGQTPSGPQTAQVWNDPYQSAGQAPAASQPAQTWNNPYQSGGQPSGSYTAPSQGQYAAPQGSGYATYQAPAGTTKSPKKRRGCLIVLAVIAALVILGALGEKLFGTKSKKIESLLDEGAAYEQAGDYEMAIGKYAEVILLDVDNPEANAGLSNCCKALSDQYAAEGDYERAVLYAKMMMTCADADMAKIEENVDNLYQKWVTKLALDGDTDKALEVLEEAKAFLTAEEYDALKTFVELAKNGGAPEPGGEEDPIEVTDQQSFAERIAQLVDAGYADTASLDVLLYEDIALDGIGVGERKTFHVSGRDAENVQIVNDEDWYYVYYGEMDGNGERDGIGWVLTYMYDDGGYALYFYIADWEHGKATGEFYEYLLSGENYDVMETYSGHLVDGYYEGEIKYCDEDGDTYYGQYSNGIPQVLGYTDEGYRITWQTEDGSSYYYVTHNDDFDPLGVACF